MVDAVARGTVAFDQALAPACLDALAGTCDRPGWEVLGLCAQPTEGTQVPGQACMAHFECAPSGPDGDYFCFDECVGLWGVEQPVGAGLCVDESPVFTPMCEDPPG